MGIRTVSSGDTAAAIGGLAADGTVIVEDFIDADLLARFNNEIDPMVEAARPGGPERYVNEMIAAFFGDKARHVTGVPGKSEVFAREILVHPLLMDVCDAILLPGCADYILNLAHVLDRGPGSEQQFPHRDEDVWVHMPRPHPHIQLATIVALVDFTADNGATVVAPGSHRWDRRRSVTDGDLVPAEMAAGSAVIYLGSTIHAGGANRTADQWRRGMHVSYCAGWLRTEENQYLTVPMDLVRTLPRRNQQLLGFGAHDAILSGGGYLGTVGLQDPAALLADGTL